MNLDEYLRKEAAKKEWSKNRYTAYIGAEIGVTKETLLSYASRRRRIPGPVAVKIHQHSKGEVTYEEMFSYKGINE